MINIKSNYSLLSSLLKIDDIINYSKKNNLGYTFISDINMYGVMEFIKKAQKEKIKPIVGLNVLLEDAKINLYATNYEGYKNIIKLSTIQNERVVNFSDLEKYSSNLICILYYDTRELYKKLAKVYSDIYLGYSNKLEEKTALTFTNKIVFFRECLYYKAVDKKYLKYLYMIRDGKTISDDIFYDIDNHELVIEDINSYSDNRGLVAIDEIAEKCNLSFPPVSNLLPEYKLDKNISQEEYLFELSKKGLNKRLNGKMESIYKERLIYELDIIKKMGFCNYFLVVYDFIKYAKLNNILVGPGRGSAAGSLVAYCLGITEIDPIKYNLLFERFLNPERRTMPDIDTDFPDDKREAVIDYVKNKYGKKKVSGIITFGTLKARQALRDVSRVMNIPSYKIDSITKLIPNINRDKLTEIYKNNPNFRNKIVNDNSLSKVFNIACFIEDFPRHISSHAAGIIMCEKELDEVIPLTVSDNMYLSSYSMEYLEDLGLLKMDFLGLRNLSIIANIINDIEKIYHKKINYNDINLDDKVVLKVFETANTTGIFQFESNGMKAFLKRLKPNSFEDIFAAIALFRPGPAINIDSYIKRKHGEEKITYIDSCLESILKNTYGIFIYQEQIMQVANIYAGYSLGEADVLRRAMSKKKFSLLKNEEERFLDKSKKLGRDLKKSKEIFDLILNFAGYGFNRSHSVAYSLIAYRLAYFKVYYKEIFYSNLLSNVISSSSKTYEYILEIKRENIKYEKPSINLSSNNYIVVDSTIYLPFSIIKDVGIVASKNIVEARGETKYTDIYDAISRLVINKVTKKTIESLIYADCFREFGYNIQTLISNLDDLIDYGVLTKDLDPSLVMKPEIEIKKEFDKDVLLEEEKNLFGFYLSNHPTSKYLVDNNNVVAINDLKKYLNRKVYTLVFVESIRVIKTKKGDNMAFLHCSDTTASIEYVLFPKTYNLYNYLEKGNIIKVYGRVERRLDSNQILVEKLEVLNGDKNEEK